MPMVTPTLNLPQPAVASSAAARTAAVAPPAAPVAATAPPAKPPDAPSTTVTLSPQAMSALAAAGHPSSQRTARPACAPARGRARRLRATNR